MNPINEMLNMLLRASDMLQQLGLYTVVGIHAAWLGKFMIGRYRDKKKWCKP